jgi:hypothetical protein
MADNQPPSCGHLNLPEPSGPHRPVMGLLSFFLLGRCICFLYLVLYMYQSLSPMLWGSKLLSSKYSNISMVHSKFYTVCFFYYPKTAHFIVYPSRYTDTGYLYDKAAVLGEYDERETVLSVDTCFCRHRIVHGSLIVCGTRCMRQGYLWQENTKKYQITWKKMGRTVCGWLSCLCV